VLAWEQTRASGCLIEGSNGKRLHKINIQNKLHSLGHGRATIFGLRAEIG